MTKVAKCWLRQYQLLVDEADGGAVDSHSSDLEPPEFQVSSIASGVNLTGMLAQNQKYRKMQTLYEKLAIVSSQYGMVEFKKKYAEVQTIIRYWESNTPIVITPVTDSGKVGYRSICYDVH